MKTINPKNDVTQSKKIKMMKTNPKKIKKIKMMKTKTIQD